MPSKVVQVLPVNHSSLISRRRAETSLRPGALFGTTLTTRALRRTSRWSLSTPLVVRNWRGKPPGKEKNHPTFWQAADHPVGQTRVSLLIRWNGLGKAGVCRRTIRSIEEGTNILNHLRLHLFVRHIRLGVLLQKELASPPWNAAKDSQPCSSQTGMIVAGDQLHAIQSALLQALQECSPVDFFSNSLSISGAARLTWEEETSTPHNCSVIAFTLRVETPCTYISASARVRARSLRRLFQ